MPISTTIMGLLKGVGTDNARDYLKTMLASSLDLIDAHDHSGGVKGTPLGLNAVTTAAITDLAVTAAKIADGACLAEILNNDGAGSGLDADLLDGHQPGALGGLDADLLDAQHGSFYQARVNHTGTQAPSTISPQGTGSALDSDTVDGSHATAFAGSGHNHDATYVNEGQANSITSGMIVAGAVPSSALSITQSKYNPASAVVVNSTTITSLINSLGNDNGTVLILGQVSFDISNAGGNRLTIILYEDVNQIIQVENHPADGKRVTYSFAIMATVGILHTTFVKAAWNTSGSSATLVNDGRWSYLQLIHLG